MYTRPMKRLDGKRAIITGAASGIGRASARIFASEGAALVLLDLDEGVRAVAQELSDAGAQAVALVGDAASEQVVRDAVQTSVERHGGLDIAFANAGIIGGLGKLLEIDRDEFQRVLEVNLIGPFLCIKHAAPYMRDHGGGAIVLTASVAGLRASAGPAHYSASKAGLINLVQLSACELSGTGVRVNALCPGLIETGMTQPMLDKARAAGKGDKIGQLNPTRRAGQPDEVARVALFLASDEASYLNGQAIAVDGGLSASLPFAPGKRW